MICLNGLFDPLLLQLGVLAPRYIWECYPIHHTPLESTWIADHDEALLVQDTSESPHNNWALSGDINPLNVWSTIYNAITKKNPHHLSLSMSWFIMLN